MLSVRLQGLNDFAEWRAKARQLLAAGMRPDQLAWRLPGEESGLFEAGDDMLPAGAGESSEGRTPADNATVRSVFVIGPDKKIKLVLTYPMTTGRNFAEILRAIDSIQLTAKHQVATPADWKQGDDVIITAAVSNEDATKRFGSYETILPYLRKTKQPSA